MVITGFLFPLFIAVLCGPALAGSSPEEKSASGGPSSVSKYAGKTTIRAGLSNSFSGMDLRDRKYADRTTRYLRDHALNAGFGVSFMGAVASGRIGFLDISHPRRRRVVNYEARAGYFARAFGVEAYYNRNGRYRITDSPYRIGWLWNRTNSGAGIRTESAGANLYIFMKDIPTLNKDYSYGAAHHQTEKQEKSGGSFMILAGADYYRLRGSRQVTPYCAELLFMHQSLYGVKEWRFIGFHFGVGFAGTMVLPRGFYLSPLITLAVHPYQMEFFTLTRTKKDFRIDSLKGQAKLSAGYDSGRFFAGISVTFDAIISPCYHFKAELWTGELNAGIFTGARI